jgi:hypothetical protein
VARIHYHCDAGLQQTYHLAYLSADAVSPSSLFGGQHHDRRSDQNFNVQFSSDLIATTAACDARGSSVIWNLTQPSIHLHGSGNDAGLSQLLQRDLSHPFVVAMAADGSVTLVGKDEAASELGRNLVRRIAGVMQVTAPQRSTFGALGWRTTEADVSGDRTSTYTLSPWIADPLGSASIAFHRRTTSVVTTTAPTRFEGSSTFSSATASDGRFGLDGSLQSIESNGFDTTTAQASVIARNQTAMRIERTSVTRVPDETESDLALYARHVLADATPLHVASDPRVVRRRTFISALGNASAESLATSVSTLRTGLRFRGRRASRETRGAVLLAPGYDCTL